jgi:hypothetical protein
MLRTALVVAFIREPHYDGSNLLITLLVAPGLS